MQSVDAFLETVEVELANTQIHMVPYKHYEEKSEFHLDPLQQFLGMLQIECTSQALKSIHNGTTLVVRTLCMERPYTHLGIF